MKTALSLFQPGFRFLTPHTPLLQACVNELADNANVYRTRMDCCNTLYNASVSATLPQGICAIPPGQWQCFVPDASQRTCYEQGMDPATGEGCAGRGLSIYPTPLACVSGVESC